MWYDDVAWTDPRKKLSREFAKRCSKSAGKQVTITTTELADAARLAPIKVDETMNQWVKAVRHLTTINIGYRVSIRRVATGYTVRKQR